MRFAARDYGRLSREQAAAVNEFFGGFLSLDNARAVCVLEGDKPIGAIAFTGRTLLEFHSLPNKNFFKQTGHTVGRELLGHFLQSHNGRLFYSTPDIGRGTRFLERLARTGLVQVVRKPEGNTYLLTPGAHLKMAPKLSLEK